MLDTMSALEKPVEYRPSRPPTAVYPDRHQVAQYRDSEFPPTATDRERVFCINLEGAFLSPGALKEMIVPLGQAVRDGMHGSAAVVVVTSDDGTADFLEALAEKHQLPIFLSTSPDAPLTKARPVGALTAAEIQTYGFIRGAGGEVTSSRVAELAGIEVNAAVNRLSALAKKGYVHRVSRPRREGDAFIDLVTAAEQSCAAAADPGPLLGTAEGFSIPEDIREGVELLASIQGADPEEVLVRAWREFAERHREELNSESKKVRQMLRDNNRQGLADYVNRRSRQRAKEAAARIKR
jgi:hypothetical protein